MSDTSALKLSAAIPSRARPAGPDAALPVVGVVAPCYGSSHVIYGLDTPGVRHRTLRSLSLARFDRGGTFLRFTPAVVTAGVDLLHMWNAIPINGRFIVSFELELPRYLGRVTDGQIRFGLRRLRSSRCRAILPISEFAMRWAAKRFVAHGFEDLLAKTAIFRGTVRDPLNDDLLAVEPGDPGRGPLRAILVGSRLFHKGATFAIEAFERLRARGHDVQLTIVGGFEQQSHGYRELIPDGESWLARARSTEWIRFLPPLQRDDVLREIRSHHVCLSPSLDESLGWIPIEAQLCGVPVIANRICAYPELVEHAATGWLIDLPVDDDGRWIGMTAQGDRGALLSTTGATIIDGIVEGIETLLRAPTLAARWGHAGREKMLAMYGCAQASRALEAIYDRALAV